MKKRESCIYQIIMDQETYPESLLSLGLFKLLDLQNQRSSLLFVLELQALLVSGHLLNSNERLFYEMEEQIKEKLFSFSPSLNLTKTLSLLSAKEMF